MAWRATVQLGSRERWSQNERHPCRTLDRHLKRSLDPCCSVVPCNCRVCQLSWMSPGGQRCTYTNFSVNFNLLTCLIKIQTASWIPVDLAASSILDMRQATSCSQSQTLHLIHPKPTNWQQIMEPLSDILGVSLVPYVEWLSRLESAARQLHQAESKADSSNGARAAIQLIPFYQTSLTASRSMTESMGLLPNVRAEQGYRSASSLQAESISKLGRPDVEKWVEYWRRTYFIPPNFTL